MKKFDISETEVFSLETMIETLFFQLISRMFQILDSLEYIFLMSTLSNLIHK